MHGSHIHRPAVSLILVIRVGKIAQKQNGSGVCKLNTMACDINDSDIVRVSRGRFFKVPERASYVISCRYRVRPKR
ncbi:hypothetical protein D3C81_1713880 [compost metagenome]